MFIIKFFLLNFEANSRINLTRKNMKEIDELTNVGRENPLC